MASTSTQSLAMLIGFWLNGVLHGIYLVLFTLWAINTRHRSAARYFVAFLWATFVASNIDFGINIYLMIKGFWYSLAQGGPDVFFEDVNDWRMIMKETISQLLVTAGDSLMVYRLYRIWSRNIYITILPICLLIAETVCGFMSLGLLSLGHFATLDTLDTLVLSLTTALQISLAVPIAIRLLDPKDIKYLQKEQRTRRFQLVRCLVESGLLLVIVLIINMVLYTRRIPFFWIINICLPQLYAITTVLIVLRMHRFTDRQTSAPTTSSHSGAQQTRISRGGVPRPPHSVVLYKEPNSTEMDDTHKTQIGDPQEDIELQGYREQGLGTKPREIYVHVEREVHHEV